MIFQAFPFSNAHELNLDWILEYIRKLPKTVNNTEPDENGNINLAGVSGVTSVDGIGADGAGNIDLVESIPDWDNPGDGFHIGSDGAGWYVFSFMTGSDGVQIICQETADNLLIRSCSSGTWSNGILMNPITQDKSGTINWNPSVVDTLNVRTITCWENSNWINLQLQFLAKAATAPMVIIATGCPIPQQTATLGIGMIKDVNTGATAPCQVQIDDMGVICMGYSGQAAQAGDEITIVMTYPKA